jgi:hypothetical protein
MGVPPSGSGCEPTASAADASSQSRIPNADDLSPKERLRELIEYLDAVGDTCFVLGGRRIYTDDLRAVLNAAERLAVTVKRIYAEQLPGTWFVCGESTSKDRNGLPAHIHVCPAYGCDWSAIYERAAAQAGEAQRAETVKQGSVHEHAVPERDAPK